MKWDCIKTLYGKAIKLFPFYLIKMYCSELNILHSILQESHRGQRMLFTLVSAGKISVFVLRL